MRIKDKELFMKYAIPCADTLVKRGKITEKKVNNLVKKIERGEKILDEETDIFKVAKAHCNFLAIKSGKKEIDKDVIEDYFLKIHDKVVDDRFKQMGDFDPERCRIFSGKVLSLDDHAFVETIAGNANYRTEFCLHLKVGDFVIVHRDFIVRKISKELAEKLNQRKKNYYRER